ncbi:hypothetical protein [Arcobacter sp.]|uniref:hypothetical protein n=1 Tax=Arcobacter sp. TaxID=1872629 RepID=UPI003D12C1BC
MNFKKALICNIEKLVGELKDEKELKEILKRKFTKKEYKVFVAYEEGQDFEQISELLDEELERVEELYKTAIKKVNQEKIKQELVEL